MGFSHGDEFRIMRMRALPFSFSVNSLIEKSSDIIRAEIVGTREHEIHFGDTEVFRWVFDVYEVSVKYVYRGNSNVNDTVEVMQLRKYQRHSPFVVRLSRNNFSRVQFSTGDDLILFLIASGGRGYQRPHILVNSLQSAYRYLPQKDEPSNANRRFESLNRWNFLRLRETDLSRIRN